MDKFGADILRLWVASTDYRNDVAMSPEIMKITADTYRTIRNTFRFQLGNLYDFDPARDLLEPADLTPLDKWALNELAVLVDSVTEAYDRYEFHRVYQLINRFYTVTLSARYHDFLKDRLYTFRADSHGRRSAQTTIYHHLGALTRLLAPVLVFTADEAFLNALGLDNASDNSVHLEGWPVVAENWRDNQTASEIEQLLQLRDPVNEKLEELRSRKQIGKSVEAALEFSCQADSALTQILRKYEADLPELYIVSGVSIVTTPEGQDFSIHVSVAEGERCPRCWRTVPDTRPTPLGKACPRCAEAVEPYCQNA